MAENCWKFTSRIWMVVWIAVFSGSASGLARTMLPGIQEGSTIDVALFYIPPILQWSALIASVMGLLLDGAKKKLYLAMCWKSHEAPKKIDPNLVRPAN